MKALLINCRLKSKPGKSNTEALAGVIAGALAANLLAVARALADRPIPAPPSE